MKASITNEFTQSMAQFGARLGAADTNAAAELAAEFGTLLHDAVTATAYKELRRAFIDAYVVARGLPDPAKGAKSAANRWAELVLAVGFEKPQTEAQKKDAARKAAKRPARAPKGKPAPTPQDDLDSPIEGHVKALGIALELSRVDADIISALHDGRVAEAVTLINSFYAHR